MTECNICGNPTEEKNSVRVGFETKFLCDECLDKIKAVFKEAKKHAEDR